MPDGRRVPLAQRPDALLFAAGVGLIGGLVGTLFQLGSRWLQRSLIGPGNLLDAASDLPWYKALLIPFCGATAAALIDYGLTRRRASQGMADVMEAVSLRTAQELSIRRTVSRALSSLALIATGGSVGREGPIAYMAASFGARLGRLSRIPRARLGLFAGCGIAAGMSASYYAPFGASLFAMEIVLGNFSVDILAPVIVSAMVSALVVNGLATDALLGDWIRGAPLYDLPAFELHHAGELAVYALLGVGAALAGWLFLRALRDGRRLFARLPIPPRLRLPLGGLLVGLIGIWLPHVWGNGYHAVNIVLAGTPLLGFVAVLFVMKIVATSVTLGSGGSGGVFTPTLFVGAAMGLLLGTAAAELLPFVQEPRHYAVVGMAATIAATTQAPMTAIILLFEMTLETGLIMPLMLAAITASVTARALGMRSVYLESLRRRGIDLPEGIEETALTTTRVSDIMRPEAAAIRENAAFDAIVGMVQRTRNNFIYVTGTENLLLGVIRLHDIKNHLAEAGIGPAVIAADLMGVVRGAAPDDTLAEILDRFDDPELSELPVLDPESGKLLGIVDRRDLISALSIEVLKSGGRRAKFVEHEGAPHYVELPSGHGLARVNAPAYMHGMTLRESDFRRRTGLMVLTIVRAGRRHFAELEMTIGEGDALIVMGPLDEIAKLGG